MAKSCLPLGAQCSYSFKPFMRFLRLFRFSSVVSWTSSSPNVLTPGCAPRIILCKPEILLTYFLPSTTMSPRLRSSLTRIFFALASSARCSASTASLRLSVSLSASRPAKRELTRVGLVDSLLTGSLRRRGALAFGFGLSGMTFFAVAEMSVRIARLASMFCRRLRSKALISGSSFLTGIFKTVVVLGQIR